MEKDNRLRQMLEHVGITLDGFIDIDALLSDPESLENVAIYIGDEVLSSQKENFDIIVCSDKIKGPFGILPLGVAVSLRIGKPMIIWKEIAIGLHKLYPTDLAIYKKIPNAKALIFHDVAEKGNTPWKIAKDLEAMGFSIYKILLIVDTGSEKVEGFQDLKNQGKVMCLIMKGERKT